MKKIFLTTILLLIAHYSFCQTQDISSVLCGKKWYPDKYKEIDGKIYDLDSDTKKLYTLFNCDGTYESWEDEGVLITGTWKYDLKTKSVLIITKDKKNLPLDDSVKILECTSKTLSFNKKDGGGESITIYCVAK